MDDSRIPPAFKLRHTLWRSRDDTDINGISWSPDGCTLASSSDDQLIRLWDLGSGERRLKLAGHTDLVTSVAWAPDSLRIASSSHDETVLLWDAKTGTAPRFIIPSCSRRIT